MRQIFLISFLAILVFLQINGEKIPVNEGAYGDGVFYRDVGRFFLDDIEESGYNLVQLTRILPFALLNLSFSTFHIVKDNEGLQNGMIIWQVIYLALALYWYFRIAKKLRLKTAISTIGFILMFFNYAWLKSVWYHPFSPDLFAFALGMGQVNYFLRYEKFKLGMVSILGAFVSPLLLLSGLLMLFLPGEKLPEYETERPKSLIPALLSLFVPLFIAGIGWGVWGWGEQTWTAQLSHAIALLAIPFLFVYGAKQNPIRWNLAWSQLKKRTKTDRLSKGIMGLAGIVLILVMLSGKNESLGLIRFLQEMGTGNFRFPLDFILVNTVHWGLPALLTLVFLHRFYQEMGKLGWAVVIILIVGLVFSVFFKITALAPWIPLWLVVLTKSFRRYRWGKKDLLMLSGISLITSLAWLPQNTEELLAFLERNDSSLLNSWALQKWALHIPEYTALWAYLLVFLLSAMLGYFFYLRRKRYMRQMHG
ncbi:hypothetical protein [Algoriphagus halophytocola]|uniref:Uncharacterized protein n=1 Tax=Algoriphagus halophytocola TaxID=2991499 RepID=A0ABY6MJJ4_9BACT|nr:hypothetical protein [Algoriphagus sp. TR-M5]UZD23946.1 hypothetical protein OM944_05495 [Algoriphagus sp. TR-M5]